MTAVMTHAAAADGVLMARALELAERGLYTTDPNPRVGCVLARDGEVVGEGWHERAGEPHAEVIALRAAGERARGAVAYVSLEPCCHAGRTPPCADALIAAGVVRVVSATLDPNPKVSGGGAARLEDAGISVETGLGAVEARALNPGFFSRFERGRPYIRMKLAMSLDARTTPAGGGQFWISGDASRADVQAWRARSSAVLTGAGTIRIDDPRLDVRLSYGPWVRQPLRIVLDPDLSCAPNSHVFAGGPALCFAALQAPSVATASTAHPAAAAAAMRTERVPRAGRGLDLGVVVGRLAALEINELFVECGPRLAAGFIEAQLVDELILYVAPRFLGADAAPLAWLTGLGAGDERLQFRFRDTRLIGEDLRLVLTPREA